jgi:hypothetical protein
MIHAFNAQGFAALSVAGQLHEVHTERAISVGLDRTRHLPGRTRKALLRILDDALAAPQTVPAQTPAAASSPGLRAGMPFPVTALARP